MSKRPAERPISSYQSTPLNPATESHYKKFLNSIPIRNKQGKSIGPAVKRGWYDVPKNSQGEIVNEIAKKFNTANPPMGINQATYKPGQHSYYHVDTNDKTHMDLVPGYHANQGPNPAIVGHELVHANDHQIDQLNPKIWEHLSTLAAPMNSFDDFGNSVGRIQDKIDLTGAFRGDAAFPNSGYPINQAYIENDMRGARGSSYQVPMANGNPDWPQLFHDIQEVVNQQGAEDQIPNPGFYLNRASEFPAFMSENLTRPWGANEVPNPLNRQEAQFLYTTLESMDRAYPEETYPTMGRYNRERRNSLNAAYPNALVSRIQPSSSSSS